MEDKKLCEIHYIQGRHRQRKEKVPESLKLERKPKNSQNQEIGGKHKGKESEKRKRTVGEALDETLKKMKLKRGDLELELIREFLKRQVEKNAEREFEEREKEKKKLTKELPNGVMAITPSPSPQNFSNAGPYNVKVGENCTSFYQRSFRSKNIEPIPVSTVQILPSVREVEKLKRGKRKKCHWCRKSSYRTLIKCTACRKQVFCVDCIEERGFDKEEVKTSCPICCETCNCRACSACQSKVVEHKDSYKDIEKVDKIQQLNYLIHLLLPLLEEMNHHQGIELEIEAKIKGVTNYEMHIPQVKLGCKKLNCCNCRASIVDFHRNCTSCSYNLCLSCCREFRQGKLRGGIKENKVMHPIRKRSCTSADKLPSKRKQNSTSRQGSGHKSIASQTLLQNWKVCEDGRISCPPKIFGGCGDSILDLRCLFSFGWTEELQVSVKDIVDSYDFPDASDVDPCCSLCSNTDHRANRIRLLQEAARRDVTSDNFLYYPTVQDLHIENLEHFQKHWGKGHPVIVRNVIQAVPNMSWDPVTMFCTYLGKSHAQAQNDKEAITTTNCFDWYEVEIGNKQIFMGSLEGQTHAYVCRETVKLNGRLSSHLFQEHFPVHYAEIMHALPLKEYIDPRSGLLNLAVKLPKEMPTPNLGPCIYIAYGELEEFMQTNFLMRLCYDSYDVVNILAHATDVPISTKELSTLKTLLKKCKGQDHTKSTENATDQPFINQVNRKSSSNTEEAEDLTGKSSIRSEVTEDSVLQDVTAEDLNLSDGMAKVSISAGDSHRGDAQSVGDQNMSNANEQDPEFNSEATIVCSGTIHRFEDSEDENSLQDDIESSSCNEEKSVADSCGAQWDIFRRQDVPKLLEYLKRHSSELSRAYCTPKHVVHPILDQSFFLDAFHKMRLKEEFNIEPWTFEQNIGEAVIVPAGCPYQVRKVKACVNVILEFISPENAPECIRLANEIRLLPRHHKAKGKVLEVEKMTLYGISDAIEEISNLTYDRR